MEIRWDICSLLAPVFEGAFQVISSVLDIVLDTLKGVADVFLSWFGTDWQTVCLSEHPFGTIKRTMGFGYFLLKGMRQSHI